MIKSRLRLRRKTLTVNVLRYSQSSGTYSSSTALSSLTATRDEKVSETGFFDPESGSIINKVHNFYFEALAGASLPAIKERDVIVTTSDNAKYQVMAIAHEGGEDDRLKVMTRRYEFVVANQ